MLNKIATSFPLMEYCFPQADEFLKRFKWNVVVVKTQFVADSMLQWTAINIKKVLWQLYLIWYFGLRPYIHWGIKSSAVLKVFLSGYSPLRNLFKSKVCRAILYNMSNFRQVVLKKILHEKYLAFKNRTGLNAILFCVLSIVSHFC